MLLHSLGLQLRIVFPLPFEVRLAAGALVLALPGLATLGTGHRATVGAYQTLLLGPGKEAGRALYAPLEVGVLEQGAIAQLTLEQFVHIVVQNALKENVQIGKVLQVFILMLHCVAQFGQLTERTAAVVDAAIGNL